MMEQKPEVKAFPDGSRIWSHQFETFSVKVYQPVTDLPEQVINFGFEAPYLLWLEEEPLNEGAAKALADENGLAEIASGHASTVVFVSPADGWDKADESLFIELIHHSRIHQYHHDGYAELNNRFTHTVEGYAIRGAIFRTCLYGSGKAADYIAAHLLKTIEGDGLWGPADVTPAVCVLENLSVTPVIGRKDIPVVSVGNADGINAAFRKEAEHFLAVETADYRELYRNFTGKYMRWVGQLQNAVDFEALGMKEEPSQVTVKTSPDNRGDDAGTAEHAIGYVAWYNKDLLQREKVPLLLCFHGGGDSAMYISEVSEWYRVAHDHDFLLVCVENHMNSTATEMTLLLEHLKQKYPVDPEKIYASGFSMGGCKSWDLMQEYPLLFAGLAPMDATFDVGLNAFGQPAPRAINMDQPVPVFYAGGEITPLPELPFQAPKCYDRIKWLLEVNDTEKRYEVSFEEHEQWAEPVWGITGDQILRFHDDSRDSVLTVHEFRSRDGRILTQLASISGQGHECRHHTCEYAWRFISRFRRKADGTLVSE